jgi:hypothetical protein
MKKIFILFAMFLIVVDLVPTKAIAHCDWMDGPVVMAA